MAGIRSATVAGAMLLAALVPAGAQAAFPGDNGPIAFEDVRESCCLYSVGADGGGLAYVQGTVASADPAISPDGRSIAFSYNRNIWVAGVNGSGARQLTTGGNNDQGAVFSPSGSQIVFKRVVGDDLFVVNLDGSGLRNLTNDAGTGQEYEPAWSPSGATIAYERDTSAGQGSIYSIPAAGGAPTNLTPEDPIPPTCEPDFFGASSDPSWSPDGSRIAFTGPSLCPGGTGPKNYGTDTWIMAANGSGKTNITNNDGPSENEPHWSPDGTRIAFLSDQQEREGNDDLYTMKADGSDVRKLLDRGIKDGDIDWGPADKGGNTTTTTTTPTTPSQPVVLQPARIAPRRLTATARTRRRRGRRELAVGGRLVLPSASTRCSGRIRITVKRGKRLLIQRTLRLPGSCRYRATLRPPGPSGTAKVAVAFLGTPGIAPKRAPTKRVRLR